MYAVRRETSPLYSARLVAGVEARGALRAALLELAVSPLEIDFLHLYPQVESVAQKYAAQFPKVNTFTIDELFGGWTKAQQTHFSDGGVFDQIYSPGTQ